MKPEARLARDRDRQLALNDDQPVQWADGEALGGMAHLVFNPKPYTMAVALCGATVAPLKVARAIDVERVCSRCHRIYVEQSALDGASTDQRPNRPGR